MKKSISKNELNRKLLHLTTIWVVLLYLLLGMFPTFLVIGGSAVVLLAMDIVRITQNPFKHLMEQLLKHLGLAAMFRASEKHSLNGATYMMLAALLTIVWLPKPIFLVAFSIVVISDALAAIIGQLYGQYKFLHKSLEGTVAFLASAWLICLTFGLAFNIPLLPLLLAAVAATAVELFASKFKMSDNLLIPIAFGIMWNICK